MPGMPIGSTGSLLAVTAILLAGCATAPSQTPPSPPPPSATTAPAPAPAPTPPTPQTVAREPAASWKTNQAAFDIIEASEGLRLQAYFYAGHWLIGYGHSGGVAKGMKITRGRAEALLQDDVAACEKAVADAVRVPVTANEFGAMVSLCFNIGGQNFARSTVVRRLNAGDRDGAADAFLLWNKGTIGGVRQAIPHLTDRRKKERALFLAAPGGASA